MKQADFHEVEDCKYQGRTSCRWCEYSYNPELYDGGCRLHFERLRKIIKASNENKQNKE